MKQLDDAADDPYKLRHLCTSLTYGATRDINAVAAKLGHSPAVCMENYQHVVRELRGIEAIDVPAYVMRIRAEAEATLQSRREDQLGGTGSADAQ